MEERCCGNCVFAMTAHNAEPGTFVCVSRPEALGEPTLVRWCDCCRRFEARPDPVVRPEPDQPPDDKTELIPLTRNKAALVDLADFLWLCEFKWRAMRVGCKFYACRSERGLTVLMHRLIMQPAPGMVVDHKNENGLDNRRINLRVCTQAQNRYNSRPHGNKSGFKGVYPQGDKWYGVVEHKGKQHYVGSFLDPAEAARARDRKAIHLFGEFAWLNFPSEIRLVSLSGTIRVRVRIRATLMIIRKK
ncbi:MAG: HNH endonuclease [Phycisphaerales bacterium]